MAPSGRLCSVLVDGVSLLDQRCSNHYCAWSAQAEAAAAFAATPARGFTLPQPGTVAFVSADHFLPDNRSGIFSSGGALLKQSSRHRSDVDSLLFVFNEIEPTQATFMARR